MDRLKA